MSCSKGPQEGSYDFFDNINEYIEKAESAKSGFTSYEDESDCESFSNIWKSEVKTKEDVKNMCKEFINLYKSLSYIKGQLDEPNYKKDSGFLNYWVNTNINAYRLKDKNCVNDFSDDMENHCMNTFTVHDLSNLLYNIKEDDFNKINVLYSLYENYYKLNRNLSTLSERNKTSLLPYSNECYDKYKIAENMHNGRNTIFYKKLREFKSTYENLYPTFENKEKEFSIYFKRLSDEQNNIITTSLLGSIAGLIPFMGILYKFTPMGKIITSKNKKFTEEYGNNDDDQISLHQGRYNIKYHSVAK